MQHITVLERQKLEFLLKCHLSVREIARRLHRDHSVILREVQRNTGQLERYTALRAQRSSDRRLRQKQSRKLDRDDQLYWEVRLQLQARRSPEQISGLLKLQHGHPVISHETIYQYIYTGEGRQAGWYHFLRCAHIRRQPRYSRKGRKSVGIPQRISIHERPEEINTKTTYGHWESDSMLFSKQKTRLSVQYERKSQLVLIHKLEDGSAQETLEALRDSVESFPTDLWQSVTFDNGKEGTKHTILKQEYGVDTYFCDPFASWQKGGVENVNKLIRQYLPLKTNMSQVSEQDIQHIQRDLNNRPRKGLGFLTPAQVIHTFLNSVVH